MLHITLFNYKCCTPPYRLSNYQIQHKLIGAYNKTLRVMCDVNFELLTSKQKPKKQQKQFHPPDYKRCRGHINKQSMPYLSILSLMSFLWNLGWSSITGVTALICRSEHTRQGKYTAENSTISTTILKQSLKHLVSTRWLVCFLRFVCVLHKIIDMIIYKLS